MCVGLHVIVYKRPQGVLAAFEKEVRCPLAICFFSEVIQILLSVLIFTLLHLLSCLSSPSLSAILLPAFFTFLTFHSGG